MGDWGWGWSCADGDSCCGGGTKCILVGVMPIQGTSQSPADPLQINTYGLDMDTENEENRVLWAFNFGLGIGHDVLTGAGLNNVVYPQKPLVTADGYVYIPWSQRHEDWDNTAPSTTVQPKSRNGVAKLNANTGALIWDLELAIQYGTLFDPFSVVSTNFFWGMATALRPDGRIVVTIPPRNPSGGAINISGEVRLGAIVDPTGFVYKYLDAPYNETQMSLFPSPAVLSTSDGGTMMVLMDGHSSEGWIGEWDSDGEWVSRLGFSGLSVVGAVQPRAISIVHDGTNLYAGRNTSIGFGAGDETDPEEAQVANQFVPTISPPPMTAGWTAFLDEFGGMIATGAQSYIFVDSVSLKNDVLVINYLLAVGKDTSIPPVTFSSQQDVIGVIHGVSPLNGGVLWSQRLDLELSQKDRYYQKGGENVNFQIGNRSAACYQHARDPVSGRVFALPNQTFVDTFSETFEGSDVWVQDFVLLGRVHELDQTTGSVKKRVFPGSESELVSYPGQPLNIIGAPLPLYQASACTVQVVAA